MEFECDPAKSAANKVKHGMSFDEAQALWDGSKLVQISARTLEEPRFLVIGMIAEKHWSAVVTYRGDLIRIISVRRSRIEEVKAYESI